MLVRAEIAAPDTELRTYRVRAAAADSAAAARNWQTVVRNIGEARTAFS